MVSATLRARMQLAVPYAVAAGVCSGVANLLTIPLITLFSPHFGFTAAIPTVREVATISLPFAISVGLVVLATLTIAPRKGLAVLWVLGLVAWLVHLAWVSYVGFRYGFGEIARLAPEPFLLWTTFLGPLALVVVLRDWPDCKFPVMSSLLALVWLGLFVFACYVMGRYGLVTYQGHLTLNPMMPWSDPVGRGLTVAVLYLWPLCAAGFFVGNSWLRHDQTELLGAA